MSLEQKINYQLNKYPAVKKVIKRAYQRTMYAISPKIKSEGNITRISPDDKDHEYFFGYYDKSPWDITDRYMLCMKANDTWSDVSPKETADILLIDTQKNEDDKDRVKKIAETRAWNVQQSCMLQWLGPDYSGRVLYNDYRDGKYVSVILTLATMEEKVIPAPVYSVSADGKFALTLDFSRLYNLRPGYGYYNVPEKTKGVALPDATAIWKLDLETGEVTEVLKYTDFANFQPRPEMKEDGSVHKVNHIMLSPNGKRFMVLYRWFIGERKYTRLITCNVDGTDMYVLSDDDMVSHCFWKDDDHIIAFENKKKSGTGYYLMKDKTQEYVHCWPEMTGDGHPSYSPDRRLVVTDSYPDRARVASLRVMNADVEKNEVNVVARVFAPFKYDNDTRCDLHPRWNHAGDKICFDSVFEGHRGLYIVNVSDCREPVIEENVERDNNGPKYSIITPMYNSFSLMDRYFESFRNQTYKNFEIIIVDDCSTDDSYKKAVDYAEKSELNIKVLKSDKNAGPGNARNIGLKIAKGDWVLFVDSDDYVEDSLLEKIHTVTLQQEVDCILFDYNRINDKKITKRDTINNAYQGMLDKKQVLINSTSNVCGKVFRSLIVKYNNVIFPDVKRFEDWAFDYQMYLLCNNFYYLKENLYNYVDNNVSIVNTAKENVYLYSLTAFSVFEERLKKYDKDICEAVFIREILYVLYRYEVLYRNKKEIDSLVETVTKNYKHWQKNQYISMFSTQQRIVLKLGAMRLYRLLGLVLSIAS